MQPLDAERVKEWRHRRMLSQQEVADRAGTSLFTIQRIERGEGNVRPKTGRGLAAALDVPIEELLPKAQAPLFREPPEHDLPEERRGDAYDVALDAARRQAVQARQAANRAMESGRAQAYFMRHENDAVMELLKYPADELAGALLEATRRSVCLENQHAWRDFIRQLAGRILGEAENKGYAPEWISEVAEIPRDITRALFDNGVIGKRETYPTEAEWRQSWEIVDALEELARAVEQAWRAQMRESEQLDQQREAAAELAQIGEQREAEKSSTEARELEAIRGERRDTA